MMKIDWLSLFIGFVVSIALFITCISYAEYLPNKIIDDNSFKQNMLCNKTKLGKYVWVNKYVSSL